MQAYQLKIEMVDLPTVWRRVIVPGQISFELLHRVIQYTMNWHDAHLYEFTAVDDSTAFTNDREGVAEYEYYRRNPPTSRDHWVVAAMENPRQLASAVEIDAILQRAKVLNYVYDFGDNWQLRISLEEVLSDYTNSFAVCIAGKEPAPPENVGGPDAYLDFLTVWHDVTHSEHETMVTWAKSLGFTGTFDLERVNQFLKWKVPLGRDRFAQLRQELNYELLLFNLPIALNPELRDEQVAETHLLMHTLDFLHRLEEAGPVKATEQGNLPAKLVVELFAQGYDYLYAPYRTELARVRREADAFFIGDLHALGRASGLLKKRGGRISLTKQGQRTLKSPARENYLSLLRDYVFAFNMGYQAGYEPLPPFMLRYLLALLGKYGETERKMEFYTERLVNIYPSLIDPHQPKERTKQRFHSSVYRIVIERFLAEFGLVTPRRGPRVEGQVLEDCFVKKTELFDAVFITW